MSDYLEHLGYQGTIEYSKDDNILFGKVLHIDSLIQYDGVSLQEISAAFREAVDGYLTLCERTGRAPNKPYSGTFNVRIGPEQHREAAIAAANNGMKLNELVREAIRVYLSGANESSVTNHVNVTIVQGETGTIDTSREDPTYWSTGHVATDNAQLARTH